MPGVIKRRVRRFRRWAKETRDAHREQDTGQQLAHALMVSGLYGMEYYAINPEWFYANKTR